MDKPLVAKARYYCSLLLLGSGTTLALLTASGFVSLQSLVSTPGTQIIHEGSKADNVARTKAANRVAKQAEATVTAGRPVRVIVTHAGIDLPVSVGKYNPKNGTWTLGYDRAYYAASTVLANDNHGSTLIYAHNLEGLFASLHHMAPGATLAVYTDNGLVFRYRFRSVEDVAPGAIGSIKSDGPPQVILQTCTGVWSERRSLFTFSFHSVEAA